MGCSRNRVALDTYFLELWELAIADKISCCHATIEETIVKYLPAIMLDTTDFKLVRYTKIRLLPRYKAYFIPESIILNSEFCCI
ncbi:hypothetical protein [Nostoc sp. NMS4]|uniref:hypothetical protein n=1 Tax=Nostoc sp. NMS4 TaxID=2815390 RepID=UPI0025D4C387|nr:hypothetical protein [Nostoc sp. NMS4]MBN3924417.1 hypothetical protein [Nostoc sp. NMS4]